jgi:hypothetical protein
MPSLTFVIKSSINEGLIISPSAFMEQYLIGVPTTGISLLKIEETIKVYQDLLEKMLGIKIKKQIISESRTYNYDDLNNFNYLRVSYSVIQAFTLLGKFGNVTRIEIPKEWLVSKKSNQGQYYKKISIVPNAEGILSNVIITSNAGMYFFRFTGFDKLPDYWNIEYLTGLEGNTDLLKNAVAKLAAIDILNMASNNIIGAGLIGQTLSLDGLSQSIQTAKSSSTGAFGYMVTQYSNDLTQVIIPALKSYYKGILMTVV